MIKVTQYGEIAVLTMVHGKANALDIELCEAVAAQFETLRVAPQRAVVLTGQARMFSAGVNLVRLSEGGADYVRRFLPALHRLYESIFFFPKPVVAAVNGHAVAGGCVLQCCADRRIAARDVGRIGVTELLVGVPFPPLAFEVMRFATPARCLADCMYSGATVLPDVALARGLVDELVEPEALLERAIAAAQALANLPSRAFAQTKQQIRQPVRDTLDRHGKQIDAASADVWTTPETLDRIYDYVAKTLKKA